MKEVVPWPFPKNVVRFAFELIASRNVYRSSFSLNAVPVSFVDPNFVRLVFQDGFLWRLSSRFIISAVGFIGKLILSNGTINSKCKFRSG